MPPLVIDCAGPEQSFELGRQLGKLLGPGDVVLLWGELGAGKTLFTCGLARGLGVPAAVPVTSPTFTFINEYAGRLPLYHLDLYRLNQPDELDTLPWRDALFGTGVAVVEWPDRLGELIPTVTWDIVIEFLGESSRRFTINRFGSADPLAAAPLLAQAAQAAATPTKEP